MRFPSLFLPTGLILAIGMVAQAQGQGLLYGSDDLNSLRLLTINTSTGAASDVAPLSDTVNAMAFDPNTNTLYAVFEEPASEVLVTINRSTGASTVIGPLGYTNVEGLAFDPNTNTLYAAEADNGNDRLLTVNTTTGAGTDIGAVGGDSFIRSLAFDPNTNTLYGLREDVPDQLVRFNTTTGAGTDIGPLGFNANESLAFDANTNTLYAVDSTDTLYVINTSTGAGTAVGPVGGGDRVIYGLAFDPDAAAAAVAAASVPALSQWGLILLAFAFMSLTGRRLTKRSG